MTICASIGADEIIDYNAQDFAKVVSGCDAVFDTVGGDVTQRSFAVLRPGGRAAFIASGAQAAETGRGATCSRCGRRSAGTARTSSASSSWSRAGAVRIPEITRFPLAQAAAAHKVSQARHFRGKLVLQVR